MLALSILKITILMSWILLNIYENYNSDVLNPVEYIRVKLLYINANVQMRFLHCNRCKYQSHIKTSSHSNRDVLRA